MSMAGHYDLGVSKLHKSFGPNKVLKGIDLTIQEGEFVGLIGPNGAANRHL
jgi:ABC-type multidrug transport system ATPase subunit